MRERLARAPAALARAQDASGGGALGGLPVDADSRLHTVDLSMPTQRDVHLLLPTAISARANEFLQSIRHRDQLVRAGAAMLDQAGRWRLQALVTLPSGTWLGATAELIVYPAFG